MFVSSELEAIPDDFLHGASLYDNNHTAHILQRPKQPLKSPEKLAATATEVLEVTCSIPSAV